MTRKTHQERADAIAKAIGKLSSDLANAGYRPDGESGGDMSLSRTFDHICEVAAMLSPMTAHARQSISAASKRAEVVKRRVRKALGYTYP